MINFMARKATNSNLRRSKCYSKCVLISCWRIHSSVIHNTHLYMYMIISSLWAILRQNKSLLYMFSEYSNLPAILYMSPVNSNPGCQNVQSWIHKIHSHTSMLLSYLTKAWYPLFVHAIQQTRHQYACKS